MAVPIDMVIFPAIMSTVGCLFRWPVFLIGSYFYSASGYGSGVVDTFIIAAGFLSNIYNVIWS